MAEKTPNQQLAEKLLFKPAYVGDKSAAVKQEAHAFAEGYKKFLDAGKTEREVAAESEQMLKDAGYQQFDPKKTYAPGDKVYFSQLGKAIVASTIGTRSFEDGFHLVIAHTDSPRLDLRPTPLYESSPFKIPACVRLSTSASSQTARGVAAARRGAAHFSRRVRVALSASPRAPKYRAACRMSMDSGFAKFRGLLGPMGIFRRLLLLNKV